MPSRFEDLERLARMLDEGKITQAEYEVLKAEILASSTNEDTGSEAAREKSSPEEPVRPKYPLLYWVVLGAGVVSVFLGGTFGMIAWATVALAVLALSTTKIAKGRWMAWTGLALGIVFSFMNLYLNGDLDGLLTSASPTSTTSTTVPEPGLAGFDYTIEEMVESWSDAVAEFQLLCDVVYEEEGLGKCLLPQLDELELFIPPITGSEVQFWEQDLILPTSFLAMTKTEGILRSVTVRGLGELENIDMLLQAKLLCVAAHGYNAELPAQADDIEERCDDLFSDLLADVLKSTDDLEQVRKQVDGVFWELQLFPVESVFGPQWLFSGTTNPATLGG